MNMTTVTSHNLYEGAYYLANGATIISITKRELPQRKAEKTGFRTQWYVKYYLAKELVDNIQFEKATMLVSELEAFRKKLKKTCQAELKEPEYEFEPRKRY